MLIRHFGNAKSTFLILILSAAVCLVFTAFTLLSRHQTSSHNLLLLLSRFHFPQLLANDEQSMARSSIFAISTPLIERQTAANRLAFKLADQFFISKWRHLILDKNSENDSIKIFAYDCARYQLGGGGYCGGLGDRVTGLVSAFYLAIATQRLFHVDWTKNANLSDFFAVNEAFYDVNPEDYQQAFKRSLDGGSSVRKARFMNRGDEARFFEWSSNPKLIEDLSQSTLVSLRTNSLAGLAGALMNPTFNATFESIMLEPWLLLKNAGGFDIPLMISAALRFVFARPTEKFESLFEKCVIKAAGGRSEWEHSYRIGVQIRHGDMGLGRSTIEQLPCFTTFVDNLVRKMIKDYNNNSTLAKILIFVTSDLQTSVDFVKNHLVNVFKDHHQIIRLVSSDVKCPKLRNVHSDKNFGNNVTDASSWLDGAKPYLDWLTLTRMQRLVVTRSGFGETASLMSLVPTHRFAHWFSDNCTFESGFNQPSTAEMSFHFGSY